MGKRVERCGNCSMPIKLDPARGWVHSASWMKLCPIGGTSIRPVKK